MAELFYQNITNFLIDRPAKNPKAGHILAIQDHSGSKPDSQAFLLPFFRPQPFKQNCAQPGNAKAGKNGQSGQDRQKSGHKQLLVNERNGNDLAKGMKNSTGYADSIYRKQTAFLADDHRKAGKRAAQGRKQK